MQYSTCWKRQLIRVEFYSRLADRNLRHVIGRLIYRPVFNVEAGHSRFMQTRKNRKMSPQLKPCRPFHDQGPVAARVRQPTVLTGACRWWDVKRAKCMQLAAIVNAKECQQDVMRNTDDRQQVAKLLISARNVNAARIGNVEERGVMKWKQTGASVI